MTKRPTAQQLLPDLFKAYVAKQEDEDTSIFGLGFSMPGNPLKGKGEFVEWADVESFLLMAQESLNVREKKAQELEQRLEEKSRQLEVTQQQKNQIARQEASASDESSFLASEVSALMAERQQLKDRVQQLVREKQFLVEENRLLRDSLADAGEEGASGSAARMQEELRAEQQRCLVLENDAMQLRARVAALERANQAQQLALLSCIEESERVRLQQEQSQACGRGRSGVALGLERLRICGSPVAHDDWALQLTSGSTTHTDDLGGCFIGGHDDYDALSHASCTTPRGGSFGGGASMGRERLPRPELPGSPSVLMAPKVEQRPTAQEVDA